MAAYKRKDQWGDVWRYRKWVMLPDGSRIRVHGSPDVNTKRAAEEAERAHIERVLNPPAPKIERRRMSDVFDRFLEDYTTTANNKPSEVAAKKSAIDRHLRPAIGPKYLDEIDEPAIEALSAKLLKTPKATRGKGMLGAKTVKNVLQTLRKCLRWAKRMKWIAVAPEIHMPRVDESPFRYLEDDELDALLTAMADEPQWYAAAVLAVDAGLRQGELRALQWGDINEVTNRLKVQRSRWRNQDGTPKSRKAREVPLTSRAREALKAIRSRSKLRGPYVFSRLADGKPFGAEYMNETIERFVRKAKLTDCAWHTLRHTFCTRLAMRGAPAKTIQELAGHSSITTTMRYMHVVKGATDAAIALLDETRARGGHGTAQGANNESEDGVVIQL
jgi:integrase